MLIVLSLFYEQNESTQVINIIKAFSVELDGTHHNDPKHCLDTGLSPLCQVV